MKRFIHNIIKSKIFRELNIFVKHFPQKNLYMEDMNFLNDILFELSIVVKDELEKENLKINSLTDYLIRKNNNSYNFVLEKYFSDAACEQINHSYAQKFSHREVSILLFSSFLIDTYDERAITLDYILEFEDPILLQPTKYNMQKVDEVNFNQTHYVVNNSAYLYNIFVNKCAKGIPLAFTILNKILKIISALSICARIRICSLQTKKL